jgi:hypothetical protein
MIVDGGAVAHVYRNASDHASRTCLCVFSDAQPGNWMYGRRGKDAEMGTPVPMQIFLIDYE